MYITYTYIYIYEYVFLHICIVSASAATSILLPRYLCVSIRLLPLHLRLFLKSTSILWLSMYLGIYLFIYPSTYLDL